MVPGTSKKVQDEHLDPDTLSDHDPIFLEFAKELSEADPNVFGNAREIVGIFNVANERFSDMEPTKRLDHVCTFTDSNWQCWAVNNQRAWNYVLNSRGIEVIQLKRGILHLRAMNMNPEELDKADDVKFLCLCLWILRQHRCIFSASLSIPVLAPRHRSIFRHLLKLTDNLRQLEILEDPFGTPPGEHLPSSRAKSSSKFQGEPWANKFDCLSRLRELGLSAVPLLGAGADSLISCAERNESLVALILIDVEMHVDAFARLIGEVIKLKNLEDFRIKMVAKEPREKYAEALSLIGQSCSLQRLYVHSDYGIESLLSGLRVNKTLLELTLDSVIARQELLAALSSFLEGHETVHHLKICLDLVEMTEDSDVLNHLHKIVSCSSLRTLVLSGSDITMEHSFAIADALRHSHLRELHLDGCRISLPAIRRFVKALERYKSMPFNELILGFLTGQGFEKVAAFKHIEQGNVRPCVTLVVDDCIIKNCSEWGSLYNPDKNFVNLSLCFSEGTETDDVFHALRSSVESLRSLSVYTKGEIQVLSGVYLVDIIRDSKQLKVVRLRCPLNARRAYQILDELGSSSCTSVLTVEFGNIGKAVAKQFEDMLSQNRSLFRLEFYWNDRANYEFFKPYLLRGLSKNRSVMSLKMYCGPQRDELFECDFEVLQYLRRNEMVFAWSVDVALRDRCVTEALVMKDFLEISEAPLDLDQGTTVISPRTVDNRTRMARMATRTPYYELDKKFKIYLPLRELYRTAKECTYRLLLAMRRHVLQDLGVTEEREKQEAED